MMRIAGIIVTYNNESIIERCLLSLKGQQISQTLVIDNSSTDKTVEIIKNKFKQVQVLLPARNLGYAGGNNLGIEEALKNKFDYVLILNPDTIFEFDCVSQLLSSAKQHKDQGVFGSMILMEDKKTVWSAGGKLDPKRFTATLLGFKKPEKEYDINQNLDFLSGTCLLVPTRLLRKGLRFYDPYFLYYEDVEFCVKANGLGYPSILVPKARIVHSEESRNFFVKDYYLARNHLLFVERNAPLWVRIREVIRFPKTLYEHIKERKWNSIRGVFDYYIRRYGERPNFL